MRSCAPLDQIPNALAKTGFLLEHMVAGEFRRQGWHVIGNRFYVDDVDEKTRELDLVAYRVMKCDDIDVVTGVLISCKKDAEHTWTFMTEERPKVDPNSDWEPVHAWTDSQPLASYLADGKWEARYISKNKKLRKSLFDASRSVFGFQLVDGSGTSPRNDKPIFDSITGLLKALDHELTALPNRAKGRKRVYLFALATVVEAPMVDVRYNGSDGVALEVDRFLHVARFLVRKRELSAFVHFVRADLVSEFAKELSELSKHNFDHMKELVKESYKALEANNDKVVEYFANRLLLRFKWQLNHALSELRSGDQVSSLTFAFENDVLYIDVDAGEEAIALLNSDERVKKVVSEGLRKIARYNGDFKFRWDIPF